MLLRIDLTLTASMNVRSAEHTKNEFVKLNMHISVLLCSPPRVAWVPPLQLATYKRLAFLLSIKWKTLYCRVMGWLRCRLGFSLLHSVIMCIRGSRSTSGGPLRGHVPASIDLAQEEGRLGATWAPPFSFLLLFSCPARVLFVLGARAVHLARGEKVSKVLWHTAHRKGEETPPPLPAKIVIFFCFFFYLVGL